VVPLILQEILSLLGAGKVKELILLLDDLKITNEMVKEHLMGLCIDKGIS
jgi:hypothetical protein